MSPNALRERRQALIRFHNVYMEYLDEIHKNGSLDQQKAYRLRGEVIERRCPPHRTHSRSRA
jgi:hypothetical protein